MARSVLNNYFHDPAFKKSPDWRELIAYLEQNTQSDEIIIQTGVDAAFGLYYEHADIAAGETGLPENFDQTIPAVVTAMENIVEQYHTIWIVGRTFADWQNAGVVEDWASEHLQLIRDTQIAGLPVRQFMSWDVQTDEVNEQALATFGDAIALMGVDISQSDITREITVLLYWEVLEQTESPLTVFVHLLGDINPETGTPLWAQDDHQPQDGRVSTDLWETGEIYRDVYRLPIEAVASGNYRLFVGFYDSLSNERLLLDDGSDAYMIGSMEIE